jgi:putative flippase GtrA
MSSNITPLEARAALDEVERGRMRVVEKIDLPAWYWWGLALGWIGLGLLNDLTAPWIAAVATFVYGAAHASVANRVLSGRHGSRQLSVRADVAGHDVARFMIAGLLALVALTVVVAVAVQADGAEHPATIASVLCAIIILLGGPRLLELARRRAR